jgi:activator of 2-hydroxyglutaryl-CoA dehydratase
MRSLGINIGSTSLKMVLADENRPLWFSATPHEGDFGAAVKKLLEECATYMPNIP